MKPIAIVTSIVMAFSIAVTPSVASARSAADGLAAAMVTASDVPE